jgi:hypothetical protein
VGYYSLYVGDVSVFPRLQLGASRSQREKMMETTEKYGDLPPTARRFPVARVTVVFLILPPTE